MGFFEESNFYPDFILWIVVEKKQHIVFIEPHGMIHAKAYKHDEKASLWERLRKLEKDVGQRSGRQDITLDSFIISATPYDDLCKRYDDGSWNRDKFAKHHILFQERNQDYDCLRNIFHGYCSNQQISGLK